MKNKVDKDFISKFDLLNSQENKSESEEIIWSDSSEYESNTSITKTSQINYRKRKRLCKKIPKKNTTLKLPITASELNYNNNMSPLSIKQNIKIKSVSPFCENQSKIFQTSPILPENKQEFSSPILSKNKENCVSPIITPKLRTQVKKNLFSSHSLETQKERSALTVPVPRSVTANLNKKVIIEMDKNQISNSIESIGNENNLFGSYNTESWKDTNRSTSPVLLVTRSVTPKFKRKKLAEMEINHLIETTVNMDNRKKLLNPYNTEPQKDTNRSPSTVLLLPKSFTPKLCRKPITETNIDAKMNLFGPYRDSESRNNTKRITSPVLLLSKSITPRLDRKAAGETENLLIPSNLESRKDTKRNTSPILPVQKSVTMKLKGDIENQLSLSPDILDQSSDEVLTLKSDPLIEKVRSYFNNHKSTTPSQASISECESVKTSKSNNDIEIVSSLETKPVTVFKVRSDSCEGSKQKKVRYKKDGLAYRLNSLLKKQKASTSLWYHERDLALNTKFIVPHEVSVIFRIKDISYKFGCCLIELADINNDVFFALLTNFQILNIMQRDAVFKLYRPYSVIDCSDFKLILNVSKYECEVLTNSSVK